MVMDGSKGDKSVTAARKRWEAATEGERGTRLKCGGVRQGKGRERGDVKCGGVTEGRASEV